MTGIGAYYYIVWAIWLRHCLNQRQDEYVLKWPSIFTIPEVIPLPLAERANGGTHVNKYSNGKTNGRVNGYGDREDRKSV